MKQNTREKILNACIKTIIDNGINKLTLESVAKEAGVSKGGLLHYFKSKNDLIKGLLEYEIVEMDNSINVSLENDNNSRGKNSRAYINSIDYSNQSTDELHNMEKLWSSLLVCFAEDPDSLQPLKQFYDDFQNKIENDQLDPVDATITRLAVDGLFLSELFNISPLSDEMREKVLKRLSDMTK